MNIERRDCYLSTLKEFHRSNGTLEHLTKFLDELEQGSITTPIALSW